MPRLRERESHADWFAVAFLVYYERSQIRTFAYYRDFLSAKSQSCESLSNPAGIYPTYDGNGNLTADGGHNYTWDGDGNPTSIDGNGVTYDALGRMVELRFTWGKDQWVYSP